MTRPASLIQAQVVDKIKREKIHKRVSAMNKAHGQILNVPEVEEPAVVDEDEPVVVAEVDESMAGIRERDTRRRGMRRCKVVESVRKCFGRKSKKPILG